MALHPIETALIGKLAADVPLTAAAPGGVWMDVAPAAVVTTCVIVSLQSALDEPQFGGVAYEDCRYLVKAVATTKTLADTAAAAIQTVLEGASLTIAGYTAMLCRREERISYAEVDGDLRWYHAGGSYHLQACA